MDLWAAVTEIHNSLQVEKKNLKQTKQLLSWQIPTHPQWFNLSSITEPCILDTRGQMAAVDTGLLHATFPSVPERVVEEVRVYGLSLNKPHNLSQIVSWDLVVFFTMSNNGEAH